MSTTQENSSSIWGESSYPWKRANKARVPVSSPTRLPSRLLFGESQAVLWVLTTYSTEEQPKDTWGSTAALACDLGICPDFTCFNPEDSVLKNAPANARDPWVGKIPGSGRSPGGWRGYPFQSSCLGNPRDRGAWKATVHGAAQSRTQLSTHRRLF